MIYSNEKEWDRVTLLPGEPSIEQLMQWENEGGCESACIHQEWVEPDGRCPECGAPSWLLYLGGLFRKEKDYGQKDHVAS